jgi:hypothetical protein
VFDTSSGKTYDAIFPVHVGDRAESEVDVGDAANDGPHRVGDVTRIEPRCGHLIEKRLEGVEVALINKSDFDGSMGKFSRSRQPPESGANDHHFVHETIASFFLYRADACICKRVQSVASAVAASPATSGLAEGPTRHLPRPTKGTELVIGTEEMRSRPL